MAKGTTTSNDLLKYYFNSTAMPDYGTGNFYISLHTADPGAGGSQTTSECTYTSYARVDLTRDTNATTGWTVSSNTATNNGSITFPAATGGTETATHFAIGSASSGTGQIIYSGALSSSIAISSGVTPQINTITVTET